MTFERGAIRDARFAPDGLSVVYSAAWDGNPLRIFMMRTDGLESVTTDTARCATAVNLASRGVGRCRSAIGTKAGYGYGTLARSSLLGSAPRVIADRRPRGRVGTRWLRAGHGSSCRNAGEPRVSHRERAVQELGVHDRHPVFSDGSHIAFADHPLFADDAGLVSVVDRAGRRVVLCGCPYDRARPGLVC